MRKTGQWGVALFMLLSAAWPQAGPGREEAQVREIIVAFEKAIERRDITAMETMVDPAMVAFENGHRNDSWADFRDNHLKPEFAEPAPAMKSEVLHVRAGASMAWGYTRGTFTNTRGRNYVLWSVYVLEKASAGAWKITMLDWSLRPLPPAAATPAKASGTSWTVEAVEAKLKAAGLVVRRDVRVEQPFLKVPGVVLVVGKNAAAEIQTYIYANAETRAADTNQLDSKKVAPPTMSPHWLMPASLVAESNFAAIILTRDPSLAEQIRMALTKPSP